MRFMLIRKADPETEAGVLPGPQLLADMGNYMEELKKAGAFLGGDGLQASSKGARVRFQNGRPTVTDGPFAETRELLAGYFIIRVKSKDEAIEWAKRWPVVDGHGNAEIEIRQFFEAEDFR